MQISRYETQDSIDTLNFHRGDNEAPPTPLDLLMAAEEPEDDEKLDLGGIVGIPRDALRQLVLFLLPRSNNRLRWPQAAARLAVIARILDVDDLGKEPLEKLAKELNCSRALLSLRTLELADGFGLGKLRSSKSAAARESYKISATESHRRQGHRVAVDSL